MKRILFSLYSAMLIFNLAQSQYLIQYPYVYPVQGSTEPSYAIGTAYLSLPRPGDAYQSLRLRGLGSGFEGLIRDPYSDQFRNPAYPLETKSDELFGDYGSQAEGGKILFGGFARAGTGVFGAFVFVDQLRHGMTSSGTQNFFSSTHGPTGDLQADNSGASTDRSGAKLSLLVHVSENTTAGLRYEYAWSEQTQKNSWTFLDPYAPWNSGENSEISQTGNTHNVTGGLTITLGKSLLAVRAGGVFTSFDLKSAYDSQGVSTVMMTRTNHEEPNESKTRAGLLGIEYTFSPTEDSFVRLLLEAASTSYSVPGQSTHAYHYAGSLGPASGYSHSGVRTVDGSISDVRAGMGFEKRISEQVRTYAGFAAGYVRNTSDLLEDVTDIDVNSTSAPRQSSKSSTATIEGMNLRMPVGAEYIIGRVVTLRGGILPQYNSGKTTTTQHMTYTPEGSYINDENRHEEDRGLSFNANFGVSLFDENYGEANFFFGSNLTDTRDWAISLRYFL